MQDEIEALGNSISNLETSPSTGQSDHEDLYKNWGRLGNQEQRRKELLDVQRSNRSNKIDNLRGIFLIANEDGERNLFNKKSQAYKPNVHVAGFNRTVSAYANVLMLSEWMVEKPENFAEEWLMAPCPKGNRALVVASGGRTQFYNKYGRFKFDSLSALPGGNPTSRKGCTILDAFYNDKNKTVYVLDMLAWKNQPMTDGESEFRHYWLNCQFSELGVSLTTVNKVNSVKFELIPMIPCTETELTKTLTVHPFFTQNNADLDGLLFYHKHAHYCSGETPLVGWLYPYMVPEIISPDIKIHANYEADKPQGYVNQKDYIPKFEAAIDKTRRRRGHKNNSMEVESPRTEVKNTIASKTDEANVSVAKKEVIVANGINASGEDAKVIKNETELIGGSEKMDAEEVKQTEYESDDDLLEGYEIVELNVE